VALEWEMTVAPSYYLHAIITCHMNMKPLRGQCPNRRELELTRAYQLSPTVGKWLPYLRCTCPLYKYGYLRL
jgi:hypothetical protein